MELNNIYGGLKTTSESHHVNAALQALLHSSALVECIRSDGDHRRTCRSLLQCMVCQLYKILKDMEQLGVGDPAPLVFKWNGISSRMTTEDKRSAMKVLVIFIDILRLQFTARNPQYSGDDLVLHPFSKMWNTSAETNDIVSDIASSIIDSLFGCKRGHCPRCMKDTRTSATEVALPQCLIIHVDRFVEGFILSPELDLQEFKFNLKSIIVQPKGKPCTFIANCPDGILRQIDDKVTFIVPSKVFVPAFPCDEKYTLIYEVKKETKLPQMVQTKPSDENNNITSQRTETSPVLKERKKSACSRKIQLMKRDKVKMEGFPTISALQSLPEELSSLDLCLSSKDNSNPSNTYVRGHVKNVSTQTNKIVKEVAEIAIQTGPFASFELCKSSDKFKFWTGLSVEDFYAVYDLIGGEEVIATLKLEYDMPTPEKLRETKLSTHDKLYMFLMRLRRGLPLEKLAEVFSMSVPMISKICYAVMRLIYLTLKGMENDMFPSAVAQRKNKPRVMRPFENLRILLDGASFHIQTPSNFEQQGNTHSKYKASNVLVFTIGISCNGATIFCSEGMEGSMSDKQVVLKSGLLERLSAGDGVMTDRGYELTAELQEIHCHFYKPPGKSERLPLSPEEEILTKGIAAARIYTEHAIADIKDNRLLQGTIPLTLLPVIEDLVYIAAYLRNFNPCRISNKKYSVNESVNEDEAEDVDNPL